MEIMKSSKLSRKSIFMITVSLIFLLWMFVVIVLLEEIEFLILFSYAVSMDWFIYPVIALYLITMGITLLFLKIKTLTKIFIGLLTGVTGIGFALLLLFGIAFGFANKAYEAEGTEIIFVRTHSMIDFYYDLYEIKLGVFAKPIAELNSMIYPYTIDQIESELNGNELIVKVLNRELTYEIHLYFDIIDGTYILVDEIQVPK